MGEKKSSVLFSQLVATFPAPTAAFFFLVFLARMR